jgi:hypothetical protein
MTKKKKRKKETVSSSQVSSQWHSLSWGDDNSVTESFPERTTAYLSGTQGIKV